MRAGMQGILGKTGKFSQKALSRADPLPTEVIGSIAEINTLL
jgi:ribonucleotide monophosphatase NagD (HAD superfamily)